MFRVWCSTESFARYIIDNANLSDYDCEIKRLLESDASKPKEFHTMPDHIRKILYLDCPDLIIEKDGNPIFSIEVSTEAGTGHNAFQRFARIAASAENGVPSFYIYPEAAYITRGNSNRRWDAINPLIFKALESVMRIYGIPALLFYFPSKYNDKNAVIGENDKGLIFDQSVEHLACPSGSSESMQSLFNIINRLISKVLQSGTSDVLSHFLNDLAVRRHRDWQNEEGVKKSQGKDVNTMSPISATYKIKSAELLSYLSRYETATYSIGELLRSRKETVIYQVNAKFRGDPYPGALAALDYMLTRIGKTYEDREYNLVLAFGKIEFDSNNRFIDVKGKSSIDEFMGTVSKCIEKSLLAKNKYKELMAEEVPRYYMQARYGSTFSKAKHIRVYSYFADAILFRDGALWRDG